MGPYLRPGCVLGLWAVYSVVGTAVLWLFISTKWVAIAGGIGIGLVLLLLHIIAWKNSNRDAENSGPGPGKNEIVN